MNADRKKAAADIVIYGDLSIGGFRPYEKNGRLSQAIAVFGEPVVRLGRDAGAELLLRGDHHRPGVADQQGTPHRRRTAAALPPLSESKRRSALGGHFWAVPASRGYIPR
jgi:hypothetical protein